MAVYGYVFFIVYLIAFSQNMAQIDPESCQLVEVPVDANGAIVVQDPSGLIAGTPVQVGSLVQTGKSVLKPELAQHLIQPVGLRVRHLCGILHLLNFICVLQICLIS